MKQMRFALTEEYIPSLIRCFLVFSLVFYGHVYLYPFEEGLSAAPNILKAVKDLVYLVVASMIVFSASRRRILVANHNSALAFMPFLAALLLVSALHAPHTGINAQAWENIKNIGIYVPLYFLPFLLREKILRTLIRDLFFLLPAMGAIQCLFVLAYHGSGRSLWDGGIYSGLIGNPNSFALLLNLGMACLLVELPNRGVKGVAVSCGLMGLFTLVMLGTTSGSQFVVLWFILLFTAAFRLKRWRRYLPVILLCLCVTSLSVAELDKTLFTMKGVGNALFGADDPVMSEQVYVSKSVSSRKENWADTLAVFAKGVDDIIFGDFETTHFKPMDGQYLVFMFNGGAITLLTFLAAAAFVYLRSLVCAWKTDDNYLFGLNLMIAIFGITFLASRVLMYFPFNFLFFLIAGLATAYPKSLGDRVMHRSINGLRK